VTDPPAPVRRRVLVAGRVQAVGFRASCFRRATDAGLSGFVRNLDDGRVEAVFEGPAVVVEALVGWCRVGPPLASVTALSVVEEPVEGTRGFRVR